MTDPRLDITSDRIDANWWAIAVELDAPRPGFVERCLRAVGLPSWVTRLVTATPGLRRAWFVALGVVVVAGLGAADATDPRGSLFTLLFLAPLAPVLGVALAYGPSSDPAYEAHLATPMRGLRLLAVRASTVLAVSVVVITGCSMLSPVTRPMAAAWLLPALALTAGSLAAMTWLAPRRATAAVAVAWATIALTARMAGSDELAMFGLTGQVTALVVAAGLGALAFIRRDTLDRLVVGS
jgi:hypothetical protein